MKNDPKSLRGFLQFCFGFGLCNLHIFNLPLAAMNGVFTSPARQLDQIDLVVSDVLLEGSARGPEVVEGILQHSSTTRVIFMTGYAGHEPLPSNNLVLQKPFDRATFLSAVAEVTGRALAPPKVMQSLL